MRRSIVLRLETRRLPEAPVGKCYADKRAYESDAFVAFDVTGAPKLTHFPRATSTGVNQTTNTVVYTKECKNAQQNNNTEHGRPTKFTPSDFSVTFI